MMLDDALWSWIAVPKCLRNTRVLHGPLWGNIVQTSNFRPIVRCIPRRYWDLPHHHGSSWPPLLSLVVAMVALLISHPLVCYTFFLASRLCTSIESSGFRVLSYQSIHQDFSFGECYGGNLDHWGFSPTCHLPALFIAAACLDCFDDMSSVGLLLLAFGVGMLVVSC
jgi:hypothetical protein